jgi:hypothetical protein
MTTQIEASKINTYQVMSQADARASKINTYQVMSQADARASKINTYLILAPVAVASGQRFLPCGMI